MKKFFLKDISLFIHTTEYICKGNILLSFHKLQIVTVLSPCLDYVYKIFLEPK